MNANDMSPEQLRKLADEKEYEGTKNCGNGKSKVAIYYLDFEFDGLICDLMDEALDGKLERLITDAELEKILNKIREHLTSNKLEKGSKFYKFKEPDGSLVWVDDQDVGVEISEYYMKDKLVIKVEK